MPRDGQPFDLGLFYGDQGGPGTSIPHTDSSKTCPFLDKQLGEFCSLDNNMCPFVGFNYRKCKKYTNNIARGALTASGGVSPQRLASNQPPRLESLTEAKKGGSKKTVADAQGEDAEQAARVATVRKDARKSRRKIAGVVSKEEAAKTPTASEIGGAEIARSMLDDLLGTKGLIDPKSPDGLTPEGRAAAELMVDDLISSRVLRKPGAHPDQYPQRLRGTIKKRIKATGWTADSEDKREKAKRVLDLAVALDRADDVEVRGGTREHRKLLAGAVLNIYGEKAKRTLRDPGHWTSNVADFRGARSGGFNLDQATTTADEIAVPILGTTYGQGASQTPSGVSNQAPSTGPHTVDGPPPSEDDAPAGPRWDVPPIDEKPPKPPRKKRTSPRKKVRFKVVSGKHFGAMDPDDEGEEEGSEDEGVPIRRRHPSGLPQSTRDARRPEHLESWLDSLTPKQLEMLFDGKKSYNPYRSKEEAVKKAKDLYKVNNTADIAKMDKWLKDKLEAAEEAITKAQEFDRDLEAEIKKTEKLWPQDREIFEKMRDSDKAREHTAKVYNKLLSNVFDYKIKKVNVGDQTVVRFLRDVSLPRLNKGDFEVIRMNEQLAMAAIQEQHQYGRRYGKFNTVMSFARDILSPAVILFFPFDSDVKTIILQQAQRLFSSPFWKQLYFSFIENPLPKYQGSDSPIPSRDAKFQAAQKMLNPATQEKIMGKYYTDPAGIYHPPDRAVLHSRSYPTTKTTWGKVRDKLLTQRFKETGKKEDWRIGFSRAARR